MLDRLLNTVHNHAPVDYVCPFCQLFAGVETDLNRRTDIVASTNLATALISPRWWPRNRGHVLVVPNDHHENIYELPAEAGHAVHDLTRRVAIAMREAYGCTGVSTRQHNEPDGNQDVWHFHVHVFPRYAGDELYSTAPLPGHADADERASYAALLRHAADGS